MKQLKDEILRAEKNRHNYHKRMKKNKYWKRGYEAAKKNKHVNDNPYTLPDDVIELLKKRSFWLMGFEEYDMTYGKIRRLKEMKKGKSDVKVYDISKLKSNGKWKANKKHHGKHKHRRHRR